MLSKSNTINTKLQCNTKYILFCDSRVTVGSFEGDTVGRVGANDGETDGSVGANDGIGVLEHVIVIAISKVSSKQ